MERRLAGVVRVVRGPTGWACCAGQTLPQAAIPGPPPGLAVARIVAPSRSRATADLESGYGNVDPTLRRPAPDLL